MENNNNNTKVKNAYASVRSNIKFLLSNFKELHAAERQNNFSNSLIFLKRGIDKLLLIERYINNIDIDTEFKNESEISDKDFNECSAIKSIVHSATLQLKQQLQDIYKRKQATLNTMNKTKLEHNLDSLNLALKNLKYIDIDIRLAHQDMEAFKEISKKEKTSKNPSFEKLKTLRGNRDYE